MFTLLTATVTISAPEALTALAHSLKFLYFPVPTINLDVNFLFEILKSGDKIEIVNFIGGG